MPRENRKRGKKHKKPAADASAEARPREDYYEEQGPEAGPSWIIPATSSHEFNPEAPFGYVDSEIKAYFRTVDVQIREWQEEGHAATSSEGADPNEDRRLFFVAALTEMSGKEKELATDPDCSNVLERMAYSMDDFARRVFMDRLTGSYRALVKHRFASHVCQTFIEVSAETVAREIRGTLPPPSADSEKGELLLMKDLLLDACEELIQDLPSLIQDPFASHVLRAIFAVLAPTLFPPEHKSSIRSRKSAAHKARQGTNKSVFEVEKAQLQSAPEEFAAKARQFVMALRDALSANEVRALAASQVACPSLQMLLEIEAAQIPVDEPGSLADCVLDGLITRIHEEESEELHPASDYVGTLLRDPTSSHLLETLVRRLPASIFDAVWATYFEGKLGRLAVHPVANFVVAKALERVSQHQLQQALEEVTSVAEKIYKSSRTGVFRAMIERAGSLKADEDTVLKMVFNAAGISEEDNKKLLIPTVLRVLTVEEFRKVEPTLKSTTEEKEFKPASSRRRGAADPSDDPSAVKTQGAVLLQSMLRVSSPHNQVILDSIYALPIDELIAMAHDVTASRVLDVILQSPSVPLKEKRRFVSHFIGHYHTLVDNRIGSRVGDNCWAFADPYLREKIARSMIAHEGSLAGSFYGKFFARNLNLYLLQRNPEQWKTSQMNAKASQSSHNASAEKVQAPAPPSSAAAPPTGQIDSGPKPKKRKPRTEDEIEQLFEEKLGKKITRAGLGSDTATASGATLKTPVQEDVPAKKRKRGDGAEQDRGLEDVLGAIKAAPKDNNCGHRSKKKKGRE